VSRVFLARHGQASFLQPDYDKLSQIGEAQAHQLGEYWAREKLIFDRVGVGPRVRQTETARLVGEAYQKAGVHFPEPVRMPEFDEYQGDAVLANSLPELLEKDKQVRSLHAAFQNSSSTKELHRNFQKLFAKIISDWVAGEIVVPGVESWPEFCARVNSGISRFVSESNPGEQAVIFTSGGPIAIAMQRALDLAPQNTLRVTWMSRNCSYSEFIFSGDRFTLSSFNAFPHFDDTSLLTYR
jgi:broad specificity phosphatase PhoE